MEKEILVAIIRFLLKLLKAHYASEMLLFLFLETFLILVYFIASKKLLIGQLPESVAFWQ
jgi:hypothetical protein